MKATIIDVIFFDDLHIPAKLGLARFCLQGLSGIYCFRHITSGKIYVGQAVDLSVRIMEHINGRHSNIHLQRAINKHGLDTFEFLVVEFVTDTSLLTTSEQLHLDWLFGLPVNMRYNICSTASSTLGYTHTAETKALLSEQKSGENHPQFGKTGENHPSFGSTRTAETKALLSVLRSGDNHPMYGKNHKVESIELIRLNHPNRIPIFVYALDGKSRKLVGEFLSLREAAKSLKIPRTTIRNYLLNGKVLNNKYIISTSPLSD